MLKHANFATIIKSEIPGSLASLDGNVMSIRDYRIATYRYLV